jgi:hypothetical protein
MKSSPASVVIATVRLRVVISVSSNGPELTGADPHAGKYSAREGGKKRGRVRCSVELAGAARNLYFELEF